MALSISAGTPYVVGDRKRVTGTITFDSSYDDDGEAITPDALGFALRIDELVATVTPGSNAGYNVHYDRTNKKVLLSRTDQVDDPEEEVPNTTNVSSVVADFAAIGV